MKALIISFGICCAALAQDPGRITVPFSDPSRPGMMNGSMAQGCFTVQGYDGKEVTIESRRGSNERHENRVPRGAEGLKRIDPMGIGLTAEEENNTIRIRSNGPHSGDLLVRVPFNTSLKIECMNGGSIKVEHVNGNLELSNLNGAVDATNVSGTVIAHSLNGHVVVTMDKVTPDKPMSFSSLNGAIDVTLPPDTKGTVHMRTDNGEIYSDFDVKLGASSKPVVEDGRSKGGKYRVKVDHTTVGAINGGGPDLKFQTYNGSIFIRKKK